MKDSKVFLKCVKTYSSYLTEGKVYPATRESDGDGYYLTTDSGGPAFQWKLKGQHADFEPAQENEEKPMTKNTPVLTPESLGCFQQVADVIGVESAREELQRVIDYHGNNFDSPFGPENEIDACFEWAETGQGYWFWGTISNGEIPEGFTPKSRTEHHHILTNGSKSAEPEFGDILHINCIPHVFIQKDEDGDYMAVTQGGESIFVGLSDFDEYAPDPYQEQRERILERWQKRCLECAWDTLVCRVDMSVSDLIDFVQDNLLAES